jgi:hypothetical protein
VTGRSHIVRSGTWHEASGGTEERGAGKDEHERIVRRALGHDPPLLYPIVDLERALADDECEEPTAATRRVRSITGARVSAGATWAVISLGPVRGFPMPGSLLVLVTAAEAVVAKSGES